MNSDDLQHFIDAHGIQATIIPLSQHTPTVADAAKALGVETRHVIKSLVFTIKDDPLLVITNGLARVDRRKLAAHIGVGRGRVKFAPADLALEGTGYVVGSMPPFGHRTKLRTIVDSAVEACDTVYGGGGDIDAMMRLETPELLKVTEAAVVDVSEDD